MNQKVQNHLKLLTFIKYGFSVILTILSVITTRRVGYVFSGLLELAVIFLIFDWLTLRAKTLGSILNSIVVFLYNAQFVVLLFGSSYLQIVMLTNLDSLEDLSGKAFIYGSIVVPGVICSQLPICGGIVVKESKKRWLLLPAAALLDVVLLLCTSIFYSPAYGYIDLVEQEISVLETRRQLENSTDEINSISFYRDEITDYIDKDDDLSDSPNVILIFTEGLSQSLVEDEREIMPNIKAFEEQSIFFENYYNHTFATYRGLIGQLYSGYQLDNLDDNYLISLNDIFQNEGYYTTFVNAEPENEEFTEYLNRFAFDDVVTGPTDGIAESVSDKSIYEVLFETAEELDQEEDPFFISIYTFGTHASLYSTDQEFEDGSNDFLNKFYDLDYQFGEFLEAFESSDLSEDTMIILTADHATYSDSDFVNACPDYSRDHSMLDRIPLCIYYKGVESMVIDVDGRNSLGLAPTICDFLDISAENYFIGTSLFSGTEGEILETVFNDGVNFYNTENSKITVLTGEKETVARTQAVAYFAQKLNQNVTEDSVKQMFANQLTIEKLEYENSIEIIFMPDDDMECESVLIPVESQARGDILWCAGELQADGSWRAVASLEEFTENDILTIKIYVNGNVFITQKNYSISD